MSFEALKQYFRSRHDKTSYTEKEPSTLFFSKDGEFRSYKILTLTSLFSVILYSVHRSAALHFYPRTVN
jgi:hypothetical protein